VNEFKRLVIREQNGALVRLEDVAEVVLGSEDYDTEVRFSGQTAVFMGIWPLPNANALDVIAAVQKEMDAIVASLPSGLNGRVAYDATKYIDNAISEVTKTLLLTLVIVAAVIFLFLGSLRSALVPLVAIPLALVGGMFLMQVFGFSLNLLTLLAIVLAVGLVVDDAIVMVENVERHLRKGKLSSAGGPDRSPRTGRAHHCHHGGSGGRLHAHRPAGRLDRIPLSGVRFHPDRRGDYIHCCGPDPLPHDVRQAA
jgi:multidrug efflux pump